MHKHDSRTFGIYANVALIIEKREIEGKGLTKANLFFFASKEKQSNIVHILRRFTFLCLPV